MNDLRNLIAVLRETRTFVAKEGNDFSWSSWIDQTQAITEINSILAEVENGSVPEIGVLFAPTGPIQEVSLSSGWKNEFPGLAERFDKEYAIVRNRP
jgi:hypothetical protein